MKNTDFEKTINNNLTKILQLDNITDNSKNKHIRLAVALSGGSDSLALTIALHQLNYDVLAILVNHNLRVEAKKEIQQTPEAYIIKSNGGTINTEELTFDSFQKKLDEEKKNSITAVYSTQKNEESLFFNPDKI